MFQPSATMAHDVYKNFHREAYNPNVDFVYANYIPRNVKYSNIPRNLQNGFRHVGLDYIIKSHLLDEWSETFFKVSKKKAVARHKRILSSIVGYKVSVAHLEELHDLGFLPIVIKALPEGVAVPYQVAPFTIENTDARFPWLTNALETVISCEYWPMCTSLTTSVAYVEQQRKAMLATGMSLDLLPFMIHDFSFRGMFGKQAAAMSSFSHLMSGSAGTDTTPAVEFAEYYYGADCEKMLLAASVNATEHSVTCSWQKEGEEAFIDYLMNIAPTGILSVVADTWDFWSLVTELLPKMKDRILARDGKLVIRPDSGDPVDIICGTIDAAEFATQEDASYFYEDAHHELAVESCEGRHECGNPEFTDICKINGKYFKVTTNFEYNRHDKTYYYVDNYSSKAGEPQFVEIEATPEMKGLVECLYETFGGEKNEAGYIMLHEKIGAIYGDAITLERQAAINDRLKQKGFCAQVVFGVGSYSFQMVTRDTHGCAIKATNVTLNTGEEVAICKDPLTDRSKKSKKGLLRVERNDRDTEYVMFDEQTRSESNRGLLLEVFRDGVHTPRNTVESIRKNSAKR